MAGLGEKAPNPHIVWHVRAQQDSMPYQTFLTARISRTDDIFVFALVTIPFSDSDEPVAKINWHWGCKMPDFVEINRQKSILMRSFKDVLAPETGNNFLRGNTGWRTYEHH